MPHIETLYLNQKALLWAANGKDNYGEVKVDDKVQINVRWEKGDTEGLDALGNKITVNSLVVVDREIAVGSILWKGTMDDYLSGEYGTGDDQSVELEQVVNYSETPDIKARSFRRVVFTVRYSKELPTLA